MLSKVQAIAAVQKKYPTRSPEFFLDYRGLYIILAVDKSDLDEGDFDPYFSVNPETGEVAEFSVVTDADRVELTNLWLAQNQ